MKFFSFCTKFSASSHSENAISENGYVNGRRGGKIIGTYYSAM